MTEENGKATPHDGGSATAVEELRQPHEHHVPVHSTPGTSRRLVVFAVVLALALGAAFIVRYLHTSRTDTALDSETAASADAPPEVDVVRVDYSPATHLLTLPGEAEAWYETTIYARVSGYVKEWVKDIGDRVKKDEVLATISTPELNDQLEAAKAKLRATQAQIKVAEADRNFAQKQYVRWKESPVGVVSKQEQEEREAQFYASEAKLTAAEAQAKLDEAEVKRLEDLTYFKEVRAPFDGTVTDRRIDFGDLVTAGSTASTTPMYSVAQADRLRVFVDVPQYASTQITMGMPATATAHEYPGSTFTGKVTHTSRSIDPTAKTLRVEVDIDNKNLKLLPGMYLEVSFQSKDAKPLLRIPASAMNFRTGGPQVAVVDRTGVVRFRNVAIARDMGDYVEVDSGVSPGDRVAMNITNQISDGQHVTAIEPEGSPPPAGPSTTTAVAERQE